MHTCQRLLILVLLTIFHINYSNLYAKDAKKWNFNLSVGGEFNKGNVNNIGLKSNAEIERNDSLLSFNSRCKFIYQKEDDEETNKGIDAGIKLDLFQYNRWSPFWATEFVTNKYKGYDYLISALTGVKLKIYQRQDTCDYSISAAFVFDNVDYTPDQSELDDKNYRISIRPKIKQRIGQVLTIKQLFFYQPSILNFSDFNLKSLTNLDCKISNHFFISLSFDYDYRSKTPTEEYKNNDFATEIALKVKF